LLNGERSDYVARRDGNKSKIPQRVFVVLSAVETSWFIGTGTTKAPRHKEITKAKQNKKRCNFLGFRWDTYAIVAFTKLSFES
jgi:hypothetical protein